MLFRSDFVAFELHLADVLVDDHGVILLLDDFAISSVLKLIESDLYGQADRSCCLKSDRVILRAIR